MKGFEEWFKEQAQSQEELPALREAYNAAITHVTELLGSEEVWLAVMRAIRKQQADFFGEAWEEAEATPSIFHYEGQATAVLNKLKEMIKE